MANQHSKILWTPSKTLLENSNMARYIKWLGEDKSLFFANYHDAWQWSVDNVADFWESIWTYYKVKSHTPYQAVLSGSQMPDVKWFEGATLNYAEHIFRKKSKTRPAIIFKSEMYVTTEMSWATLESQTAALAQTLKKAGVKQGDRVVGYLPNSPHAIVAVLAAMSLGAVWSCCSPDFGASSVADRFLQIEPKVLIAVDGYAYGGKSFDKRAVVQELCGLLPSVKTVVFIPFLAENARLDGVNNVVYWEDAVREQPKKLRFMAVPFAHPMWVLYSSGTTGVPKAITHSHGGNLLEHLKYTHLHNDIRPGERFFWFSTTGWMMWNFTVAALLAGSTIVLYDGSPGYPNLDVLWEYAEETKINHFGTSAPFLVSCMKAGLSPKKSYGLKSLRSIGSTGSPLPPDAFDYVYKQIKKSVWLSSMAGGTDICTAWVGGNPLLPVHQGEIQCRCLGTAMESWDEDGHSQPVGAIGEMVVTQPMPCMPAFFWNDADGSKYKSSYFEHFPGVWRHGDWIQITENDGIVILGRSDSTLNRQGVRIGTAEIYRAMDNIPDLKDSLIINVEKADGTDWMPLFVVPNVGFSINDDLKNRIKKALRTQYSPRHVPDEIIEAPDLPYTISGKKMETPVKKIFQGRPLDKAFNKDSMRNPEVMEFYIEKAEAWRREVGEEQ